MESYYVAATGAACKLFSQFMDTRDSSEKPEDSNNKMVVAVRTASIAGTLCFGFVSVRASIDLLNKYVFRKDISELPASVAAAGISVAFIALSAIYYERGAASKKEVEQLKKTAKEEREKHNKNFQELKKKYNETLEEYNVYKKEAKQFKKETIQKDQDFKALKEEYEGLSEDFQNLQGAYSNLDQALVKLEKEKSKLLEANKDLEIQLRAQKLLNESKRKSSKDKMPSFLTELTANKKEVIYLGREEKRRMILDMLHSKDECNNVLLIGEAGCGKTEMVRYFASEIQKNNLQGFDGYRVFSMTANGIIAGTRYRGDLEINVKSLFDFLNKLEEPVILFIDEVHQLIGGGSGSNEATDLGGMLLTQITNKKIRVIGATTPQESKFLDRNGPLKSRFLEVKLRLLNKGEKYEIFNSIIAKIKEKKGVNLEPIGKKLFEHLKERSIRKVEQILSIFVSKIERREVSLEEAYEELRKENFLID